MKFENFGPFEINLAPNRRLKGPFGKFWNGVERDAPGLPSAQGCYIFAIRASGGNPRPWYVGRTEKSFKHECFQPHKLVHYADALTRYPSRGVPSLLLIAMVTEKGGKFSISKSVATTVVPNLEDYLILLALRRNPLLRNIKGTKFWREAVVPGVVNNRTKRFDEATKSLRVTLELG